MVYTPDQKLRTYGIAVVILNQSNYIEVTTAVQY